LPGAGTKPRARRDRGLSDEERDAVNAARARQALAEAERAATYAQNAALDGRAEKAQEYARQAAELIERAAAAANAIGDDDTAARLLDQVAEAQARELEAQAAMKKKQAAEIEQKNAAQAKALGELEERLQKIAEGATVTVRPDTTAAEQALAAVQAAVDAIPAEKTITVRTVHVVEGAGSGDGGAGLVDELRREALRNGNRR
jgi:membrane protein involved in colicin uptake